MKMYRNNKTGELYEVISFELTNCTNSQDGLKMVLYKNEYNVCFCRERNEFFQKFTLARLEDKE
jgi:hypothetical protein